MYSQSTPNYALPQFQTNDRLDPIADFNPAFSTIDTQLKENANNIAQYTDVPSDIAQLKSDLQTTNGNLLIAKNAADQANANADNRLKVIGTPRIINIPVVLTSVGANWDTAPVIQIPEYACIVYCGFTENPNLVLEGQFARVIFTIRYNNDPNLQINLAENVTQLNNASLRWSTFTNSIVPLTKANITGRVFIETSSTIPQGGINAVITFVEII